MIYILYILNQDTRTRVSFSFKTILFKLGTSIGRIFVIFNAH